MTSASNNVAIGNSSLAGMLTGTNCVAVGNLADVTFGSITNSSALGCLAIVNNSHKIRLGGATVSVIEGQVAYSFPSDARFKNNIAANVPGLDFIKELKPVTYKFDTRKFDQHLMQNMPDSLMKARMEGTDYTESSNIIHTGFLAQDIVASCNKLGYDFDGLHIADPSNPTDNYSVAYSQFVMPLVKSVQELSAQNEALKAEIEAMKADPTVPTATAPAATAVVDPAILDMIHDLQAEIAELKGQRNVEIQVLGDKVVTLEHDLQSCCLASANAAATATQGAQPASASDLFQNSPNPFSQETIIQYYLAADVQNAAIEVSSTAGVKLMSFPITETGYGKLVLQGGALTAGTYYYSLIIDGKTIRTNKMMLIK